MPRQTRWWILTYVCVSALVHLFVAARACAPAQDTIRFMNYSRRLLNEPVGAVLASESQHPLFPVLGAVVIKCAGWFGGEPTAVLYWRSLQLASALASVLVIPAIFWMADRIAGRVAAVWGTAIVAFSPRLVGVGADGLSDSLHLALVAWALVSLFRAAEGDGASRKLWWGLAGSLGGLAFLTRPEGILAVSAALLVIGIVAVARPVERAAVLRGLATSAAVLAVFVAGFFGLTGRISTKVSVARMLGFNAADPESNAVAAVVGPFAAPGEGFVTGEKARTERVVYVATNGDYLPSGRAAAADRIPEGDGHGPLPPGLNWWTATEEYIKELSSATQYIGLALACVGLPIVLRRHRGTMVVALLVVFASFTAVLFRLYLTSGYISMRHVLVPTMCLVPFVGTGASWLMTEFVPWLGKRVLGRASHETRARRIALGCLLVGIAACYLPVYWKPLHASRAGAMAAAEWLFRQAEPDDTVFDAHLISGAMAGLRTYGLAALPHALRDPRLTFVVVDQSDLSRSDHPYDRIRAFVRDRGIKVAQFVLPDRPEASTIVFRVMDVRTAGQEDRRDLR